MRGENQGYPEKIHASGHKTDLSGIWPLRSPYEDENKQAVWEEGGKGEIGESRGLVCPKRVELKERCCYQGKTQPEPSKGSLSLT